MVIKKKPKKEITTPRRLTVIIKNARDIMRKDKGLNGDLDRLPQLTWIMFLKFLDDIEKVNHSEARVGGKSYVPIIEYPYRWRDWADNPEGITGDELLSFLNNDEVIRADGKQGPGLLPYLRSLDTSNGRDARYVIASVFRGVLNRMINGYLLRDVINKVNEINFTSSEEIHVLSHLYESILKELRDSAGDSGEFYTPRPVIKFMVKMVDPKMGQTILDPAAGTGGFLIESFLHLEEQCKTTNDYKRLQKNTIQGVEAKSLPYMLCQMNLLLHGMEFPNIDPLNALRHPLNEIGKNDRVDVILTNPPFGGSEETGILSNFPNDMQTNETALLFMQLIMRKLRRKNEGKFTGKCAMIVNNGPLSGDGAAARIKKQLLEQFNLHTIVRLPNGVFAPYTSIPTNLLFFDSSNPTKEIWYYELPLPEGRKNYSKTKPLNFLEFQPLMEWWDERKENDQSWKVSIDKIIEKGYNLDNKNPNKKNEYEDVSLEKLTEKILKNQKSMEGLMTHIKKSLIKEK